MADKFTEWYKKHKKVVDRAITGLFVVAALILGVALIEGFSGSGHEDADEVSYTEFMQYVSEGKVDTVYYRPEREYMVFTLLNEDTVSMSPEDRQLYEYPDDSYRKVLYPAYEDFRKDLLLQDINLKLADKEIIWENVLTNILSLLLPVIVIIVLFRSMVNGVGSKNSTLVQTSDKRFTDVIGQDEILDDIRFVVELIKNPDRGVQIGAKVPRGILLSGSPGTGKTLIAKAIAGEAGVPFIYMSGSQFVEIYAGVGAKRVRDLFADAKKNAPCVIFIDEIDAIGGRRDARNGSSESDHTLNEILTQMDGFTGRENVFVIAATNQPGKLDKALLRSGRFDRQITINPPRDWKTRRQLFSHYLRKMKVSSSLDLDNISRQVTGFTGADIEAVCNEASIVAMMEGKECIDDGCMEEAIDKKVFHGNRSKSEGFNDDKRVTAYHEAGHAVMSWLKHRPLTRASIISMTSGVGGVVFEGEAESQFLTDVSIRDNIMVAYAGRASEELKFGVVTTGASNDITQATNLMLQYIERFGFDKDFGMLDMEVLLERSMLDSSGVVDRMSEMSKSLYADTLRMLESEYGRVELLAQELLDKETLSGEDIQALLEGRD